MSETERYRTSDALTTLLNASRGTLRELHVREEIVGVLHRLRRAILQVYEDALRTP